MVTVNDYDEDLIEKAQEELAKQDSCCSKCGEPSNLLHEGMCWYCYSHCTK